MLPNGSTPVMPMGAAARLPISAGDLLPAIRPGAGVPPAAAQGLMAGPGGTPMGTFPAPDAPSEPPYDTQIQADGSALWVTKTDPPVVIGVIPAPKLPQSLQPPKQ